MQISTPSIAQSNLPILIVGQGLAGTILAYQLLQAGQKVVVIDAQYPSSSAVAAGIFNPVTGKRLVKTWLADELFPYLFSFYHQLEQVFGVKLLHKSPIYRPFLNIEQQNFQTAHSADIPEYLTSDFNHTLFEPFVNNQLGGILTLSAGWVDVKKMLDCAKIYFESKGILSSKIFDFEQIIIKDNIVFYKDCAYQKIIFCEGAYVSQNPYFSSLPFRTVHGELLIVKIENLPAFGFDYQINQGIFIIPLGNHLYKVGATYNWKKTTWQTTQEGKEQLIDKLKQILKVDFEVMDHLVGIRPATQERRPLIGLHPEHQTLGIFNGFGSKGVALVPYFAKQFVNFLLKDQQLDPLVNINKYFSLTC